MSERGGSTTQSGILYQNSISAIYLGRLCDAVSRQDADSVTAVRVEAPTEVDDTVITFADGHSAYIQAKESIDASQPAWAKLWKDFGSQYSLPTFQRGHDRLQLLVGTQIKEHNQLRELCERAANSSDNKEWLNRLSAPQKELADKIRPLVDRKTQVDDEWSEFLGHVDVEVWPLTYIERDLVPVWMPTSNMPQWTLFRLLRDRVGGKARVRGAFAAESLRHDLEKTDNVLFSVSVPLDELREALRGCGALLRQQRHTFGHTGRHVRRGIVDDIVDWAQSTDVDRNIAVLLDQAGSGKTVVMRDILLALEGLGLTVLAVKADQQLTGLTRYEDLPSLLRLPDTVERSVSRLVTDGPVVVLIDQIDALSLSMARDQAALNVVLDLMARLRRLPGVRLIVSCRTFDFKSDARLRRTADAQQFYLNELAEDEVRVVLTEAGIKYDQLSAATLALLRIPLHLDLFLTAARKSGDEKRPLHVVATLQDLYGALWQDVIAAPEVDAPPSADRAEVVRRLTEYMDREQRTSAPQSLVTMQGNAHIERAARWLASEGILVAAGNEWSFLHQTFFDYCYAKQFVEDGRSLTELIITGDQGLRARPQILQVLTYLRGINPQSCLSELNRLLSHTDLRFHLQDLLIRWFGSLPNPSDEEWTLMQRKLADSSQRPRFLQAAYGNGGWFDRLRSRMPAWLNQGGQAVDEQFIPYLASLLDVRQVEVLKLLRSYLGRSPEWDNRLYGLLSRIARWETEEAIELFEQYVLAVPVAALHQAYQLDDIAEQNPAAGIRLIRYAFDRLLESFEREQETRQTGFRRGFLGVIEELNGSTTERALQIIREAEPELFLEQMVPWLEQVVRMAPEPNPSDMYYSSDGLSHGWHDSVYVVQHELIEAFTGALVTVAGRKPEVFRKHAAHLAQMPYQTPQQLLARSYTTVAPYYASDALDFLVGDARRLNLGDHEQYESRRLVAALFPQLSVPQRETLENTILSHVPIRRYSGTAGLRWRGLETLYLLQAIPPSLLTREAAKRLREWQDKFPGMQASEKPIGMQGGVVGPPISRDAVAKMSDRAWLRAMRKYQGAVRHPNFLKGGAQQLSGVLAERVKKEPERFHRLLQKASIDLDDSYVQAWISGLGEADAPAEWLFEAIRRFAPYRSSELRRSVARALNNRASSGLPDDMLELLESCVRDTHLDGEEDGDDRLSFRYLNSDRGSAFGALMDALRAKGADALPRRWAMVEYVAGDASTSLRFGATEELLYMFHEDRERAVSLFERLLAGHEALLFSHWPQEFVYYALDRFFDRIASVIRAIMDSPSDEVQQRGAELACIAAISPPVLAKEADRLAARALAEEAVAGRAAWRRGAARIFAHNLLRDTTDVCATALFKLLDDEDEQVRRFAGGQFHSYGGEDFFSLQPFIEAFAGSRALGDSRRQFAGYLWEHGLLDPRWTLSVVERVLENPHRLEGQFDYGSSEPLVRLVIRIYTAPTEDALRSRAMDLFDRLMALYQGSAQLVLGEWDRQ